MAQARRKVVRQSHKKMFKVEPILGGDFSIAQPEEDLKTGDLLCGEYCPWDPNVPDLQPDTYFMILEIKDRIDSPKHWKADVLFLPTQQIIPATIYVDK